MIIEGRIAAVGVHKDGVKYAVIEITDTRFKSSVDSIHIGNNEDFNPGEFVDIEINPRLK